MSAPFWKTLTLEQLSDEQWESLCDGCAKCCLHKYEDTETNEIYLTTVACRLLDISKCRCKNYTNRQKEVPECLSLRNEPKEFLLKMPETCAYRLIYEGQELPTWHPLVSGQPDSVWLAKQTVSDIAISENEVPIEDLDDYFQFDDETE